MKIALTKERLTPGVRIEGATLCIPAEGGGFSLNEMGRTAERYLNFILTVHEEHSMPFELRIYGAEETPRVTIRFGVMPRYRTNICIDLNWLDGHVLFPGHLPGELKVVCHGLRIDRKDVRRAELVGVPVHHAIRAAFEAVEWSDTPLRAADVPAEPIIDELGQYIPKSWPGKVADVDALTGLLRAQAGQPGAYPFAHWTQYGGCADQRLCEGTGYFASVKREGRWYLTDPEGCAFFSVGPDCVGVRCDARVDGLEPLMRWLPDPLDPAWPDLYDPKPRAFGEVSRAPGKLFSFGRANLRRAFGDEGAQTWRHMVVGQLKRAGMNTLGNWSDETLFGRMPYVTSLERFPATKHSIFRDFPDVLSPEYREDAERCAQALLARRDDPWMIGYFLRNEPNWAFADGLFIAEEVLRDTENTWCKRGLIDWLEGRYGAVGAFNAAWNLQLSAYDGLLQPIENAASLSEQARQDLRQFSAYLIREYTRIPAQACRTVDPNHMILGMRWAWVSDPMLVAGWENFDVFSINCYAVDPTAAIDRVCKLGVDLPVMIGEFHFGALDAGPTATGLEAVTSQHERGVAYRYYCERVAAHLCGVGCHYFQCYDQFALGRFDGENYNIGLFDVCLQPYQEMLEEVRACSETIYDVKAGLRAPTQIRPQSIPMIAY